MFIADTKFQFSKIKKKKRRRPCQININSSNGRGRFIVIQTYNHTSIKLQVILSSNTIMLVTCCYKWNKLLQLELINSEMNITLKTPNLTCF